MFDGKVSEGKKLPLTQVVQLKLPTAARLLFIYHII